MFLKEISSLYFFCWQVINNLKEIENSPHLFVPDATVLCVGCVLHCIA